MQKNEFMVGPSDVLAQATGVVLEGSDGVDELSGGDGDDQAWGRGGDDVLSGGAGHDSLDGGDGDDVLIGEDGNDSLVSGQGDDFLMGGAGDDRYIISGGKEHFLLEFAGEGYDEVLVQVDGVKLINTGNIERIQYAEGVLPLAYWIDALYSGASWNRPGDAVTISFGFPESSQRPEGDPSFRAFSEADKASVRQTLQIWANGTLLRFEEVPASEAQLRFNFSSLPEGTAGWANYPDGDFSNIEIDVEGMGGALQQQGSFWQEVLSHEIGHALGAKHPGDYNGSEGSGEGPFLPVTEDTTAYTLMSYIGFDTFKPELRSFDIAFTQYLFGIAPSVNAGDTVYRVSELTGNFRLIGDGSGIDTIDGTLVDSRGADTITLHMDLREGAINYQDGWGGNTISSAGYFSINYNTVIENAIGSWGNDRINGNAAANRLQGLLGNDTLRGYGGADTLDGGAGDDLYLLIDGVAAQIVDSAGLDRVETNLRSLTLAEGLENVRFVGDADADFDLIGNALDNKVEATGGDNVFNGGGGQDTLSYAGAAAGVALSLALSAAQATGGSGIDRISGFEHLIGGQFDDLLSGDAQANRIEGGDGADSLNGGAGADTLIGGSGDNHFWIDNAQDVVVSSGWSETLHLDLASYVASANFATYYLERAGGVDLTATAADSRIYAGLGNDRIDAGAGIDTVSYEHASGGITINLIAGGFSVSGAMGQDQLLGVEWLIGSRHGDRWIGSAGADTLAAGIGADTLQGGAGDDVYRGLTAAHQVIEASGGGHDRAEYQGGQVQLADFVEDGVLAYWGMPEFQVPVSIELSGNALNNLLRGGDLADTLKGGAGNDRLEGGNGQDMLDGGSGADTMVGGSGGDHYWVDDSGDLIVAEVPQPVDFLHLKASDYSLPMNIYTVFIETAAATRLVGSAYANLIYAGSGDNYIDAGDNLIWFVGDMNVDIVSYEHASGGVQIVRNGSGFLVTGASGRDELLNVEKVIASNFNDRIEGDAQADTLDGGAGADTLIGGAGNDTYVLDRVDDVLVEQAGGGHADWAHYQYAQAVLPDQVENGRLLLEGGGQLVGNALGNLLLGSGGADTLDGGAGADTLDGGAGDDVYRVDDVADVTGETGTWFAAGGTDKVLASVSHTLGQGIEQLELLGNASISAYGNALDNLLIANNGNNTLYGGSGVDTVSYTKAAAAVTVSLETSNAQATGGSGTDTLRLIEGLIGSAHNDRLTGNGLWNLLDGGLGDDTLEGGQGSDTYVIDSAGDVIVETLLDIGLGGADWVHTSLASFTLGATLEHGLLLSAGAANLFGNAANNIVVAGAGDNRLFGGSGVDTVSYERAAAGVTVDLSLSTAQNTVGSGIDTLSTFENLIGSRHGDLLKGNALWNWIDGGEGADTMEGGAGSDTYVVDNESDVVIEQAGAAGSANSDWVYSRLGYYQLGEHIENAAVDHANGGYLSGNALDNVLMSGGGNDTLIGGSGSDTASYQRAVSAVTVHLAANTALEGSRSDYLIDIENLIGSSFNDLLVGDGGANDIRGGSGSDVIRGGGGNDILRGGGNNQGDGAADSFVFDTAPNGNTNYDRIVAFEGNGLDRIVLDPAIYGAIGATLDASEFRIGANALDADDFILFDRTTGNLFYDVDGSGAGAKVLFAKLINWSGSIDAGDFGVAPPGP
jgi:Ca2+-binding RTX toxin-like protein